MEKQGGNIGFFLSLKHKIEYTDFGVFARERGRKHQLKLKCCG